MIDSPGTTPSIARQFPIELFDGESIIARFDHFDPNSTGVTWVGTVDGVPMSSVTLVYGNGTMAGSIHLLDRSFTIRPAPASAVATGAGRVTGPALHVLSEINQS